MPTTDQTLNPVNLWTRRRPAPGPSVAAIGAVCVFVSLVGPVWTRVPANPTTGLSAAQLDFSQLAATVTSGAAPSTWLQHSYFSWLAWTLMSATIIAFAGCMGAARRRWSLALAVLGVAGLVVTVVALKGTMSWSQAWDARGMMQQQLGIGCVLTLIGYLLIPVGAIVAMSRRVRSGGASA
ncbi:hypothetical protein NONO_c36430 [Nocardia nova SH22a]|uniref:Transmembrane protein n=1 Tax=Nocardia nova SH22a TaxID=1415166 RepID=W5TGH2_9NOCA|nr:hypothetical protein [Nocardia nova]AHH18430.1 hypothetical protein NONO_c36430 [Nocardia nova SH22a]